MDSSAAIQTAAGTQLRSVKRERAKGRRETGDFHQVPTRLLRSRCWYSLSSKSVKLFWDLYVQYNGFNNGDLSMTWSQMEKRGWRSRETLNNARLELIEHRLIVQTRQGGKHWPSLYAVTFRSIDDCNGKHDLKETKVASNEWRQWKPDNRADQSR